MKRRVLSLAICLVVALMSLIVRAGSEDFSPWEAWREGFSFFEKGGREKEKGNLAAALQLYKQARDRYLRVRNARPEWNQKIIGNRIQMCDAEISALEKQEEPSSRFPSSSGAASSGRDSEELAALKTELAKYKQKLFAALVEIDDLRRSLQRADANVRQTEDLMREKRVIEEKLRTLQQQYDQLESKLSRPDAEKGRLENRLVEEKMKADLLARKMKMMQDKEDKLRRELAELYRARTAFEIKEKEYKERIQRLERDNITLEKHGATVQGQQRELQDKITRLNSQNQQHHDNAKKYKQEIAKLNQWVDELRKEGGDQTRLTQETFEENKQLKKRQSQLLEENQSFKEQIEILQNNLRASNINTVQSNNTLARINEQKKLLEQQYRLLQEDFQQSKNSAASNRDELDNLRKQNRRLENDLKTFAEKYETARKRLADRSASEYQNILTLNRRNQQLTEELTQQNINLEKLQSKFNTTEKNKQILESRLAELQNENRQLSANQKVMELENEKITTIEQKLKRQREINSRLQNQLDQTAPLAAKYQKSLKKLEELTKLKEDYLRLQQTNQELSDKNRRLQLTITDLERSQQNQAVTEQQLLELKNLHEANRELAKDNRNYLDKNDLLTERNRSLAEKIDTLSTRIENLDKVRYEYEKLQGEKKRRDTAVSQQTQQLQELRNKLTEATSRAAANLKKYEESSRIKDGLSAKYKNLEAQLASQIEINQKLETKIQQLATAEKEHAELQSRMAELQTKANQTEQLNEREKKYQAVVEQIQEKNNMAKKLPDLKKTIAKISAERDRLSSEIKQLRKQASAADATLDERTKSLSEAQAQREAMHRELLAAKKQYREMATKQQAQDEKLAELIKQNVSVQARLKVYKEKIASFEKQSGNDASTIQQLRIENKKLNRAANTMKARIEKLDDQLAALPSSASTAGKTLTRPESISEERLAQLLRDGAKAEEREADDVAIWNYRQIIDAMPKNVTALHRLGIVLLKRGQHDEAADLLQKAYIINPYDVDIAINYAKSLIAMDRAGNALAVLRKVRKGKEVKNAELSLVLGRVLFATGQIDEAGEQFEHVVKLAPDQPEGYLWQARVLAVNPENLDSAVGYYRRARKLGASPDSSLEKTLADHLSDNADMIDFMSKAALEAEKSGDWTSAVWYYAQLGQISPGNQLFSNKLAMSYLFQNQPDKALEEVVTDNNPPGAMIAGVAAAMQQDAALALKFLELAQQHQQSLPDWLKPLHVIGKKHLSKTSEVNADAGKALRILEQLGRP